MNLDELGYVATEDGRFVSGDHMRIAEIIQDYDPDLRLAWIPPDGRRGEDTRPWAVFYKGKLVSTYEWCDHRILAHLWSIDSNRNDVLSRLDTENAAAEAVRLKKELEVSEFRQDIVASTLKSPLHKYKLPSGAVIRDA